MLQPNNWESGERVGKSISGPTYREMTTEAHRLFAEIAGGLPMSSELSLEPGGDVGDDAVPAEFVERLVEHLRVGSQRLVGAAEALEEDPRRSGVDHGVRLAEDQDGRE